MERIRQRLLDEGAGIKKSEEKKKEREGKKFGKQVQLEKLKERERGKKEMEERLKGLKRSERPIRLSLSLLSDDAYVLLQNERISWTILRQGTTHSTLQLKMPSRTVLIMQNEAEAPAVQNFLDKRGIKNMDSEVLANVPSKIRRSLLITLSLLPGREAKVASEVVAASDEEVAVEVRVAVLNVWAKAGGWQLRVKHDGDPKLLHAKSCKKVYITPNVNPS
jgi:hypothetical protein